MRHTLSVPISGRAAEAPLVGADSQDVRAMPVRPSPLARASVCVANFERLLRRWA